MRPPSPSRFWAALLPTLSQSGVMQSAGTSPIVTVFRSRLRSDAEKNGYAELAARMEARAKAMPGFVDFKSYAADDGERVSIITFDSAEHQEAWRNDPEHREAQRRGRQDFYREYSISVCERKSHRSFRSPPATGECAP